MRDTKTLRSLIHEFFPEELRVELELLSLQRSFSNYEKQEELILLLQKYDVKGIVKLGSGTNRYAFKLNGYVVKFATDNDGKIDNLKEFKMAKRLYPYVIQCHEVSRSGTIMICEYIRPFESYTEFCRHIGEIRSILTDLSNAYLIGDVGITDKNYANWGKRIGKSEPVCLDFAYVYACRSDIMSCINCGSVLEPDADFNILLCSHNGCGARYKFEDIRNKIGNDVHSHEIGDLGDESYELFSSHIPTQLDLERSNYMARDKNAKSSTKCIKQEDEYVSTKPEFVMRTPMN